MTTISGWLSRISILMAQGPKNPWGGSSGGGDGGSGGDGGPRNPWSPPPSGNGRGGKPTALDEFLKRARPPGGGGGGGGGGRPQFQAPPNAGRLIGIGIALLVGLWLVYTSVHQIGPQQRGVVTLFGRYYGTLEPGIRTTLPAPFTSVRKVDVQKINTDNFPDGAGGENLMLTSDQNIIDLDYSVRWDISNPQDYSFQIKNPEATVRATAESSMRAVIATTTLDEAIGAGRGKIEGQVQEMMQDILNDYSAGIRIQGVAIKNAQPPAAVADAFKAVSAAQQTAQGNINQAKGYAQQQLAYAQGEATAFDKLYEQARLAPEVTRRRMYYETMEQILARANKTIVDAPGVTPYLPLPGIAGKRAGEPQTTPAPSTGGGR